MTQEDIVEAHLQKAMRSGMVAKIYEQELREIMLNLFVSAHDNYFDRNQQKKRVAKMDLSGNIISTFESEKEAARLTGISHYNISRVANGRRHSTGGFKWKFV
jgi:hypothetical protein